ncbi:MAG: hypothetical protein FJ123_00255 [Deltaproteobacteria bacterium]|nr:hypothetical protein [Deltaproteobacteria bacterium]
MTTLEERSEERRKRFEEFKRNLPEKVIFRKAGPDGEDIVLQKSIINRAPVYTADVEIPFLGELCERRRKNEKK